MFDHAVAERFLKPENRRIVLANSDVNEILREMDEWKPVLTEKWLDRSTR